MSAGSLSAFGALIADPTRAEILTALMGGRAHTGGELARHAGVQPSTASEHLSRLTTAGMVSVEAQGRHRYFRLADKGIADLLERLGVAPVAPAPSASDGLRYARTCYDHVAGELAVRLYDRMVASGHVVEHDDHVELTRAGTDFLHDLGARLAESPARRRPAARRCLDWTERRHHLAGSAGAALLEVLLERRWIVRGPRPRSLRVTGSGHRSIPPAFGLATLTPE